MVEFILGQLRIRQVSLAEEPTVFFIKSFTSLLFCNLDKGYCINSSRPKISIAKNAPLSRASPWKRKAGFPLIRWRHTSYEIG